MTGLASRVDDWYDRQLVLLLRWIGRRIMHDRRC